MAEQRRRNDHLGYIQAVVGDLEALDIKVDKLVNMATEPALDWVGMNTIGEIKRVTGMYLHDCYAWPWHEFYRWTVDVLWDEEFGWAMTKTLEPEINMSSGRGRVYGCYSLDLGSVPEPSVVALRVEAVLSTEYVPSGQPWRLRDATDYSRPFESALAAYLRDL